MKEPVFSTYKILKDKVFNSDIDESWIDWAIAMMQAGYETESLYQLAGISKPYNQFELQDLTNKVLNDLQLDFSDKKIILKNYAYFLIKSNIDTSENYEKILREFWDIHYELNEDADYQNFTFLYWAKDNLDYSDSQSYWEGANKDNIDEIIKQQFQLYIAKIETEKYNKLS